MEARGGDTTWSSGTEKTSPLVVWKTTCPSRRARRVTAILRPSLRTRTSSARAGATTQNRRRAAAQSRCMSVLRLLGVARVLEVGEADGLPPGRAHRAIVHSQLRRRLEALGPGGGDQVILLDAVAADPDPTNELAAL